MSMPEGVIYSKIDAMRKLALHFSHDLLNNILIHENNSYLASLRLNALIQARKGRIRMKIIHITSTHATKLAHTLLSS